MIERDDYYGFMEQPAQPWSNRYVGLPYQEFGRTSGGCDCWGLACIIYRDQLGLSLPEYTGDYTSVEEHGEIAALIDGAAVSPLWVPVCGTPMAFDIAVFRRGRFSTHIGIIISPGLMIHMDGEDCAKVADYRTGRWSHRFTGHFRHASRAVELPVQTASGVAR